MILILAPQNDPVADALQQRLPADAPVLRLSPDDLVFAPHWVHRIDENGKPETELGLLNGQLIHSGDVQVVFNRIVYLEAIHFLNETDRIYADMEFNSLFYSFLQSLSGSMLQPFWLQQMQAAVANEWILKSTAIALGIPVTDLELSSAPRWKQLKNMVPFDSQKTRTNGFYKQAPHLIWENKPVRQQAGIRRIIRVFISGDCLISEIEIPFDAALKQLARDSGSAYAEARIAECADGTMRLYEMDTRPETVNPKAIEALAEAMLGKTVQAV